MTGSTISGFGASGGLGDAATTPGRCREVLAFPRSRHVPWQAPGPRARQRQVQLTFGAFWSPAGGIDPAPSIPVMHRAGSGAEPGTNVPSGKGMGCGSWQGLAGAPRAMCTQLPGEAHAKHTGSLLKDMGVSYSCWVGRCSGKHKDVQSCCSSCGAAIPATQPPLPAREANTCHDGGEPVVLHVPSCTLRPQAPEDRLELPWLLAQTQYRGITPHPAPCHGEPKQLLWRP